MALEYALFENHLTSDPDDYMAVVQNVQSKTREDVIDLMISRGSTVTKAEALSTLEEYAVALVQLVQDGHAVNTPLFNVHPSIKGVFNGGDAVFSPSIHAVQVNVSAGVRLREAAKGISPKKVLGASPHPDPLYLDDLGSGTRNEQLTPGNIAQLKGSRLKFDASDPEQGIFLTSEVNTVLRVSMVSRNKPAQIDFLVPQLPPGAYQLSVRNKQNTSELRVGTLKALLQRVP